LLGVVLLVRSSGTRCLCRALRLPLDQLPIQLLRLGVGLHAELTPEDAHARLVLPEGGAPPAESLVEAHQRSMGRLLQRIERDEPERGLEGALERRRPLLMSEKLGQGLHGQLSQAVSLSDQPVLEERSAEGEALEEIAAI